MFQIQELRNVNYTVAYGAVWCNCVYVHRRFREKRTEPHKKQKNKSNKAEPKQKSNKTNKSKNSYILS